MDKQGKIDWSRVKAILFDIDGTLSDSDDRMVMRLERFLKPLLFLFSAERQHRIARWLVMALESPGNFLYNLTDRLDLDSLWIRILNRRSQQKIHRLKKFWIIPGTQDMLIKLAGKLPLGVVSARDEASSLAFIRQFNLAPHFRVVVTSQTCRHTKPFPEPLLHAAGKLKVKPEHCLMVGDTTVDIRAARLAGMQSLGVLCGFGTERELLRAGANQIMASPVEILDWLEKIIQAN